MKKFKAFTLVETLIVIVVFCIGILVVLQWLSQTLRNKDYADIQIKSAFFAREGIELMFNLRDANYHKELPWNCIFKRNDNPSSQPIDLDEEENDETESLFCDWKFISWTVLKIWIWSENEYINVTTWTLNDDFDEIFSGYQIYFHTWTDILWENTWFVYNHNEEWWEWTRFARYLLIKWVTDGENEISEDKLLKIESHVLYKKWYLTWEKVMETFIGNYEFTQ